MSQPRSNITFHATAFLGLAILLTLGAAAQASSIAVIPTRSTAFSGTTQGDSVYSLLSCFAKTVKRLHGQAAIARTRFRSPQVLLWNKKQLGFEDLYLSSSPDVAVYLIDLPPPAL